MATLSSEKKKDSNVSHFLKSRAENPHFIILGDIQNLAELETKAQRKIMQIKIKCRKHPFKKGK